MSGLVERNGALLLSSEHLGLLLQSTDDTVYSSQEVLLIHLLLIMASRDERSLITYVSDVGTREARCLTRQQIHIHRLIQLEWLQVNTEYLLALIQVGEVYMYLTVKASCTQQCLIKNIHTVCCCQDNDTRVGTEAIHLCEQLVERILTLIIATHRWVLATRTTYGVNLINKDDTGSLLLSLAEEVAHTRGTHTHKHLHEVRA